MPKSIARRSGRNAWTHGSFRGDDANRDNVHSTFLEYVPVFAIHPDSDRLPSRSHSNRFDAADKGEDFDKAVADIKKEKED